MEFSLKWGKFKETTEEIRTESEENYDYLSDLSDMDRMKELRGRIRTENEIKSNSIRKKHLTFYALLIEKSRKQIQERIMLCNNMFIFKFVEAEFTAHFNTLIEAEQNEFLLALRTNISTYDFLLKRTDMAQYVRSGLAETISSICEKHARSADGSSIYFENLRDI